MLQINTTSTQWKNVEIDGVQFEVRNLGAGEQLTLTQLSKKVSPLRQRVEDSADVKEDEATQLVEAVDQIFTIYRGCFKDTHDGKDVSDLFNRISFEDIGMIIGKVFNNAANNA